MTHFNISLAGKNLGDAETLVKAIEKAESMLKAVEQGTQASYSVRNADNVLMASISNRRIIGTFTKQQLGGRKGSDAIYIGTEDFDATDEILLMSRADLIAVQDNFETTDDLGRSYIQWPGPCDVSIVESISSYFGVDYLEEITEEVLTEVRNRVKPQPRAEVDLVLNVSLKLRMAPGGDLNDFLKKLDVSVISNTAGVSPTITGTKRAE